MNKRVRSNRLLFLSEITTPLYFYLNSKYKENYEDQVNIKFRCLKSNRKKEDKEMWSFKKPVKSNVGYYNMNLKLEKFEFEEFQKEISEKPLVELFSDHKAPIYDTLEILTKQNLNENASMEIGNEIHFDSKNGCEKEIKIIENCLHESTFLNEKFDQVLSLNDKEDIKILDVNQKKNVVLKQNDSVYYDPIYFKIDEFLIRKSSMDRLLSNKWLSDNVKFILNKKKNIIFFFRS